jgi:DNA-directed RNA polymerase
MQVQKIFWIADMYRDDELFFPYQLDFRGRVYAVPDYLNPQGCDLAKGLLLFAEAKPINTDDAERWFFIHGANCFGEDKMAFDGRVEWVKAHHAEIIASATDPHNNLWWADADKPWQFLAWAREYKAYNEQGRGYMSHCVISMDGSCNGLQHFSAMLRDPVGGKATNLLPSDTPQDIYQIVADKVNAVLDSIIKTGKDMEQVDMAHKWRLFGVNRKLAKRPVMVLPYGGTLFSCRQYVEDYLKEQVEAGAESPWPVEQYLTATQFLATLIWDAIGDTVQSARRAMDWLQAAAKVAADENLPLSWETPSGFPVIQAYPETKSKQVETHIAGQLTKISLSRDTDDIDKRRQAQGISPNFVHSLDAAAMVKAILYAQTDGVTAFAMVHDSYGTHAADAEAMALSLRKAFVDMYGNCNVLEDFRQAVLAMVSEKNAPKILPCPDMGDLDITRVMLSDFFFA